MSKVRYAVLGFAVVLLVLFFCMGSDDDLLSPEHTGIVVDVNEGDNGFTFILETRDSDIRCFSSDVPMELGYYEVIGDFSKDGRIFFVEQLIYLDRWMCIHPDM